MRNQKGKGPRVPTDEQKKRLEKLERELEEVRRKVVKKKTTTDN